VSLVVSLRYARRRPSPRVSHERATSPIRCLRQLRRQKDLTKEQLTEVAGIAVDMLSNIERGVNAPSFETMRMYYTALEDAVLIHSQFL
jgi:transcriptional regulator with XRE-family HTH domain